MRLMMKLEEEILVTIELKMFIIISPFKNADQHKQNDFSSCFMWV
jgi:hypothetical protein